MKNLLLFFGVIFLFACNKDEVNSGPTNVSGKVVEYNSNKPIRNAKVFLTKQDNGSWSALGIKQIAQTTSDDNGNYTFDFDAEENSIYQVCAKSENYATE